jgi:hypothetical protein
MVSSQKDVRAYCSEGHRDSWLDARYVSKLLVEKCSSVKLMASAESTGQ